MLRSVTQTPDGKSNAPPALVLTHRACRLTRLSTIFAIAAQPPNRKNPRQARGHGGYQHDEVKFHFIHRHLS
jgi:hypothetical protein